MRHLANHWLLATLFLVSSSLYAVPLVDAQLTYADGVRDVYSRGKGKGKGYGGKGKGGKGKGYRGKGKGGGGGNDDDDDSKSKYSRSRSHYDDDDSKSKYSRSRSDDDDDSSGKGRPSSGKGRSGKGRSGKGRSGKGRSGKGRYNSADKSKTDKSKEKSKSKKKKKRMFKKVDETDEKVSTWHYINATSGESGFDDDPKDFDILRDLITTVDLVGLLENPEDGGLEGITFFGPWDDAFYKVAQRLGYDDIYDEEEIFVFLASSLTTFAESKGKTLIEVIESILSYHIGEPKKTVDRLRETGYVTTTYEGLDLDVEAVSKDRTMLIDESRTNPKIHDKLNDLRTTNGVFHYIKSVLLPYDDIFGEPQQSKESEDDDSGDDDDDDNDDRSPTMQPTFDATTLAPTTP